jgi:GAF domain-containing protein
MAVSDDLARLQQQVHSSLEQAKLAERAAKERLATLSRGEEGSMARESYDQQVKDVERLHGRVLTLAEIAVRMEDDDDNGD